MNFGNQPKAGQGQRIAQPAATAVERPVAVQQPDPAPPVSILDGDVQGDAAQNLVVKIQGVTAPAAVSADDQKFIKYDDPTAAFVMAAPSVTLAGDVRGASGANTVGKLLGATIPALASGYLHTNGTTLDWATPAAGAGYSEVGHFVRDNISSITTSPSQMSQPGETAARQVGETMFRSGHIVGIACDLNGAVGVTGSDKYRVTVYKKVPSAGYVITTVTADAIQASVCYTDATAASVAFNAGDILAIFDEKVTGSTLIAVAAKARILVQFD